MSTEPTGTAAAAQRRAAPTTLTAPTDLNAARKARAGRTDDGRCSCGRYRLFCRHGCLDTQR